MSEKKVVCIYDEPEMIDLIKLILGRKGFELSGAIGGREGLDVVRRVKPDLILLNLYMPGMDGWEVNQHLKADKELKDIPVIIMTAKVPPGVMHAFAGTKVDDFVTVPFGPQELLQSVKRVLQTPSGG